MYYNVYKVASLGAPRDHLGIFVEINTVDGSGVTTHVTGNIQSGMIFEQMTVERPELNAGFVKKSLLGRILVDDLHRVEEICRNIPPPKKQFDGPKRLYPKEPLRRCQEWTNEAVEALVSNSVLQVQY